LKFGLLFSFVLLLTSILNLLAQQQRYQGEIMVTVCGMTGQDTSWTVSAQALSSTRWNVENGQCYITTGYSSASVSGEGNNAMPSGFRCPYCHDEDGRDLAFSEYEFSWDLPSPHSDPDPIDLDLRDADWTNNYSSPYDITIRYNITDSKYEVRIGGQGNPFNELTDDTIWDILDEAPPNQEAFQPPPPRNFRCTNAGQIGQHPQLMWSVPDEPDIDEDDFTYSIYRRQGSGSFNCVASNLLATNWTDQEVVITPKFQGFNISYYATAYTDQSPESEPSRTANIWGLNVQKSLPKYSEQNPQEWEANQRQTNLILSTYPNPFNPATAIFYQVPDEGHVQITIYNIAGQRIKQLVNEIQQAGAYQIYFDGQYFAGGIYLLRLHFNNQYLTKKILLFK
jgi:hypothetical protein